MDYGLTNKGFVKKRLDIIKQELQEAYKAKFGVAINLEEEAPFGQTIGISAERESLLWELIEALWFSLKRSTAEGTSLDDVNALISVTRLGALASIATVRARGDENVVIEQGSIISMVNDSTKRFVTQTESTIGLALDAVQKLTFSAVPLEGTWTLTFEDQTTTNLVYNSNTAAIVAALEGLSNIEDVEVLGDYTAGFTVRFKGIDGRLQKSALVANSSLLRNTVVVEIGVEVVEEGGSYVDVDVKCDETGPVDAAANTLTVIETVISGWESVTNREAAITGRNEETDEAYRLRAEQSTQQSESGTVEALKNALTNVEDVLNARVFENYTLLTDDDGLPAKSFECVIDGGLEQDILNTIWTAKPAGIEPYGNTTGSVTDSQGIIHTIGYSRPVDVLIYIDITVSVKTGYSVTATQVTDALVAYGSDLAMGESVIVYPDLITSLASLKLSDISLTIGVTPNPTLDDNIAIQPRQRARFNETRINVTIV